MKNILYESLSSTKRLRNLIFFVAILYTLSFLLGYSMVHLNIGFALELREEILRGIEEQPIYQPILRYLETGELLKSILYTFLLNLTLGAFLSTTLTGVVFPIPILVTMIRGFVIGIAYYGIFSTPQTSALALGTLVFELGAYVLSGACGINLGLSFLFPKRFETGDRFEAFKISLRDVIYIYPLVIALLVLGAIWEMTWIHFLT